MIVTVTLNPAIDQTIEVDRFAEGDTNRVTSIRLELGGKGINVARGLKELGYEPLAMGFAPGAMGRVIEDQLTDLGIGVDFTYISGETRTNVTIIDREQQRHTVLSAKGPNVTGDDLRHLYAKIDRRLRRDTWLVIAGSLPPPCTGEVYRILIEHAEKNGALSALDADGPIVRDVLDRGGRPTLIKVNADELGRIYGDPVGTEDEVFEAAETVRALGVPVVIVTRRAQGAIALTMEADYRVRIPDIDVVSARGAGDAFLAGLLLGLRRGESWEPALARAGAAGAACCLTPTNSPPRSADLPALQSGIVVERVAQRTTSR
ncbi:MAG: 1-phosphofructokinase family hexose kinase [Dehalococcoidia bacterium]